MLLPTNIATGRVTGQFLAGVVDGVDDDQDPDAVPAAGFVTFTASVPYLPDPTAAPNPATILTTSVVAVLDNEGYLCTPAQGTLEPSYRGVRLIATDDPDLSVSGWTWNATYSFSTVAGQKLAIPTHSFAVPSGGVVDLTTVVKVPSSAGIGTEQAEALAASAQAAAIQSAQDAATAAQAAVDAAAAAQVTDTGIAALVATPGSATALEVAGLVDESNAAKLDADEAINTFQSQAALDSAAAAKVNTAGTATNTAVKSIADTSAAAAAGPKVSKGELVINAADYGALDATGATDSYATLQAALDATPSGRTLLIPSGTYLINNTLTVTGKTLRISAFGVKIIVGAGVAVGFALTGGMETVYAVSALGGGPVTSGDGDDVPVAILTTATATNYQPGDVVKMVADDAILGGRPPTGTKVSRVGQFFTVHSATGTTLKLFGDLTDPYTTNIRVARMKDLTLQIDDLEMTAAVPISATRMFHIFEFINPTLNSIRVAQSGSQVFNMGSCYGYNINNPMIGYATNDPSSSLYGYGVNDVGCFGGKVNGMIARYVRHAYTDGTDQIDADDSLRRYGRSMNAIVSNSTGHATGSTSFDTHQYSQHVTFDNCKSYNSPLGFAFRGRKHVINNCYSYKPSKAGLMIFSENPTDGDSWGHIINGITVDTPNNQSIIGQVNLASNVRDTRITAHFANVKLINAKPNGVAFINMTVKFNDWDMQTTDFASNADKAISLTRTWMTGNNMRVDMSNISSSVSGLFMAQLIDNSKLSVSSLRPVFGTQATADKFAFLVDTATSAISMFELPDIEMDYWKASAHLMDWANSNASSYAIWKAKNTAASWSSFYTQFSTSTTSTPLNALSRTLATGILLAGSLSAGNTNLPALRSGRFMGQQVTISALTGTAGATLTIKNGATGNIITKTAADTVLNLGDSMNVRWDGTTWRQV